MDEYLQTSEHLYSKCEALASRRLSLFGQAFDKPLHTIKKTLILKFLREADIKVFPSDRENAELRHNSGILNEEEEQD